MRKHSAGSGRLVKIAAWTLAAITAGIALLAIAGSLRYGGLDNLVLRVRAEIAARRPHPLLVPTPLPYEGKDATATSARRCTWRSKCLRWPTR